MASLDIVRAQTGFEALCLGRSDQTIVGRLLRYWDSKNIKKQCEFMGITLLLLDEKGGWEGNEDRGGKWSLNKLWNGLSRGAETLGSKYTCKSLGFKKNRCGVT
ncbi:unnamed protein product [Cochlearia groenlandica]